MSSRNLTVVLFAFIFIFAALYPRADEGMWPLYDLDKLPFDSLHARGLELTADEIYDPDKPDISDAIVSLGGGTGSFVSPNGLIVTNYHVAFGAIQKKSTVENDYIVHGFYAENDKAEIPAIGYNAYVTLSSEDITERVMASVSDDLDDLQRYNAIDNIKKRIIKEAEAGRDVYCSVSEMHGGNQFILYTYFKIKDVRIVYAPPESIGSYGGDVDNWMWPRHTGDFSFLRAYVAPDGSSAEYSEENVPYRPKAYLPVSSAGVREGDFAMIIGFPGRTSRYASSFHLDDLFNNYYPSRIESYEEVLAILNEFSEKEPSTAIKLAGSISGFNNGLKNSYGMRDGFRRSSILAEKQENEKKLIKFINGESSLREKYRTVISDLDSLYREKIATREKDNILRWLTRTCDMLTMASSIYKWSIEREKPDIERERRYQDRDSSRTIRWLNYSQINLVPAVDRALLAHFITKARELPAGQKIMAVEKIFSEKSDFENQEQLNRFLDNLFSQTQIGDLDTRLNMFHMAKDVLENLNDPMIDFAISLRPEQDEARERSKKFSGAESRLEPKLIQAIAEWKKGKLYSDANGSKRFNYGEVMGYSPQDAITYAYITSLTGVMEKETGEDPFIVPAELVEVFRRKDFASYADPVIGDVPVCFLTTNDGTGGNSGSPIINGRGELIGLDFDSNYEGIAADYLFSTDLARSIVVDIRYVLFIIDKVYHLDALMEEMAVH